MSEQDLAPAHRGQWMQTATGRAFFLDDPSAVDIDIRDIAQALSHLCRFGGHVNTFYSVAQHSLLVSDIAVRLYQQRGGFLFNGPARQVALAGLLHDAAEAYVGDVVAPLKRILPDYGRIERKIADTVAARFDVGHILGSGVGVSALRDAVHDADMIALATEKRDIVHPVAPFQWIELPAPLPEPITPWSALRARERFLSRFFALLNDIAARKTSVPRETDEGAL